MSVVYIIIAVFMIGLMVAVHEFGHFSVAKLLKIRVIGFSLGVGPAIWKKQKGETLYALRAFPLGGFCSIPRLPEDLEAADAAEAPTEADAARELGVLNARPRWQRILVMLAGSVFNLFGAFLLALLIQLVITLSGHYVQATNTVAGFLDGFPLSGEQGLLPGDRIVSIDGHRIFDTRDFSFYSSFAGDTMDLAVVRNGRRLELDGFPLRLRDYTDESGNTVRKYGLLFAQEDLTPWLAPRNALRDCVYFVRLTAFSLSALLSGGLSLQDFSSPVGFVKSVSDAGTQAKSAGQGLQTVFTLIVYLNISVALFNLLPIPALDGGQILFTLLSGLFLLVFRREPNPKVEQYINTFCMLLFFGLTALILIKDVVQLF